MQGNEFPDLLMWVGGSFYTIESFIAEAKRMGVCKRIPIIPDYIKLGKSRLFLAHDMTEEEKRLGKRGPGRVFAYCVIRGISYIVKPGVDIPEELKKRGVTKYEYVPGGFGFRNERGCGSLQIGGTYLLSEEDLEKCKDLAESGTLNGNIQVIDPPIEFDKNVIKRFRGYRYVDGDKILARAPPEEWFIDPSNLRKLKVKVAPAVPRKKKIEVPTLLRWM